MKYLYFVIIVIFIVSCKKPTDEYFYMMTKFERSWNIYHIHDSVTFRNNNGNIVKYYVRNIDRKMIPQKFYSDELGRDYTKEYESIKITFVRDNYADCMILELTKGYGFYKDFLLFFIYDSDADCLSAFNLNNLDTISIGNVFYTGVSTCTCSQISKCYYQKQKGFLRIENINGEILERAD